ncbi:hypothetical protein [Streptomyces sp. NPDC058613]|uniref:hypothetical protein n=1 Tax=Streptomyces sp. NPDC058613 TaxID=3346556 RepID=UPI0036489A16
MRTDAAVLVGRGGDDYVCCRKQGRSDELASGPRRQIENEVVVLTKDAVKCVTEPSQSTAVSGSEPLRSSAYSGVL